MKGLTEGTPFPRNGNGTPGNPVIAPLRPDRTAELVAHIRALTLDRNELARQVDKGRRRDEARDDLVRIVSHDLKNALTVVRGNAQLALRRVSTPVWSAAQIGTDLTRLDRAGAALAGQIDQLTAVILAGQSSHLERRPCDLVALAHQVATDYQAMTDRHQIRVESTAPALVGTWDAQGLARLLANLLANAIKYSPDAGDVVVTVASALGLGGRAAVMTVRDHGIGIPVGDLPFLFAPFCRATNVGSVNGTGLGLASVKQVVARHGGTIVVASQEGIGTTVTIHLPLTRPPEHAAHPSSVDS